MVSSRWLALLAWGIVTATKAVEAQQWRRRFEAERTRRERAEASEQQARAELAAAQQTAGELRSQMAALQRQLSASTQNGPRQVGTDGEPETSPNPPR